jgi:soluble lytic murein transglycosylase-like protein
MKLSARMAIFLLDCWLCCPAWAAIYAFTGDDGAVSLSNVPTDERYTLLIGTPEKANAPATSASGLRVKANLTRKTDYDRVVDKVSGSYGLEGALLHAVITVESRYNPRAVSAKGATGLMQLMPATAKRYGVADAFDPAQNIDGGAQYLRYLLGQFNNDMSLALAAYNAGETAVAKYGNRIPPYRETRNYVSQVLDFYQLYRSGL